MKDFLLTPNFSFFELTVTEHRKFLTVNRDEALKIITWGQKLCEELMQPIRDHYKKFVFIHSGFRCKALNKAIKGSRNSQHCLFQACDFHIAEENLLDVFHWIWKESGLKFGQLILEGWSKNHPSWLHISLQGNRKPKNCQQVLTFDGEKYQIVSQ